MIVQDGSSPAERPIVVIAGAPRWAATAAAALRAHGFTPRRYKDRRGYVARLVDDRAALILADGDGEGWRFWTTTPRVSPATRRIPVVLVSGDAERRRGALAAGADVALAPDEVPSRLPALLADYARRLDDDRMAQLMDQCAEPLPPLAREAIALFNAGEYYRQHDLLEALWMAEPGPVRDLYRGILQVGVAYYHITRGNRRGALKMLLRSAQWLARLPDVCRGVDVAQLHADANRVRAALEAADAAGTAHLDEALLKPVRWADTR